MDHEQSIAVVFNAVAERHAERLAIKERGFSLSFRDLGRRANGIARAIASHQGVEPGAVALLMEHGAHVPVSVLATFKANGFFVQLDPETPTALNAWLLADSGASVLLTDQHHHTAALALAADVGTDIHVIQVDGPAFENMLAPPLTSKGHDLCCLVYTSGSTGRPKGVRQLHRNFLHHTLNYTKIAGFDCHDRFSYLQSATTVSGITPLLAALLNGASLHPFRVRQSGLESMAEWLQEERISCLHVVPTLFRRLVPFLEQRQTGFANLRLLRLGGEAVTQSDLQHCLRLFGGKCRLLAGLSSSETLDSVMQLHTEHSTQYAAALPLGQCQADMEIELVDETGSRLEALGVGEIHVRSQFLFAGYWKQDELTSRVLVPDPQDQTRAIFRTGDLARLDTDGNLFHAGRVDNQTKVAGHKVDLVEIENAIRQIPRVHNAAALVRLRDNAPAVVHALVVRGGDAVPELDAVRAHLRDSLPRNALPASITFVEDLPLLPGGKIDRQALEELVQKQAMTQRPEYLAPRNPVEETLHVIWSRVLGRNDFGVLDDFFEHIGGDSLAVAEILTEASEIFALDLPLSLLFEAPTVAAMAECLGKSAWCMPDNGLLALNPDGHRTPLFAICGVYGHALRLLPLGRELGREQPFFGLQPPAMDWQASNCHTIEQMAACYREQILKVQPQGPYRLMGTSFGGIMAFEIAIQLQQLGQEVTMLCMVDTFPPRPDGQLGPDREMLYRKIAAAPETEGIMGKSNQVAMAHYQALEKYTPQSTFNGSIQYFACIAGEALPELDERRAWCRHATGELSLVPVPGAHGSFHQEPQFSALVQGLKDLIKG